MNQYPKQKLVIPDAHILRNAHGLDFDRWQQLGAEVVEGECVTEEDLIRECADSHVIVFFGDNLPLTARVLEALPSCRLILRTAIGYDSVDVEAATRLGIIVANCAGYCVEEVATHALAFVLMCNHQLMTRDSSVRAGRWHEELEHPTHRLSERTVGVIGLGQIGGLFAHKVSPLVGRVLGCDPYVTNSPDAEIVSLDELLAESDFVSLHTPLTSETRGLIGERELGLMRPPAYLINTSRGPVVDQPALYDALLAKQIAGAALDVVETEPPTKPLHDIFSLPNAFFSPHSAAGSPSARADLWKIATENVAAVLENRLPETIVNPDVKPRG